MLIAYLADMLGKRLGKKRVSLFGMRPRRTAMMLTVIAGAIISLATFGILSSLSRPIKDMLFRTEEIRKQLVTLSAERKRLDSEVRMQSDTLQTQRAEIETLTQDRDKIKSQRDEYENDANVLSTEIVNKQAQLDDLARNQKKLETQISSLGKQLSDSQGKLQNVETQLADLKSELDKTIRDKETVTKEIDNLKQEQTDKIAVIEGLNVRIAELNTNRMELEKQIRKMQTEEIQFSEGQRLYGFTVKNDLLMSSVRDMVLQSIRVFNQSITKSGCSIDYPDASALVDLLDGIQSSKAQESIVMVFSKKNCFSGDKIPVEFMAFDQYVVFEANAIIYSERIDKKLNLLEARSLLDRLMDNAALKAHDEKGLLRDPQGRIFKFTSATLDSMAEDIADHKVPMIVKFVAKSRIERADYLNESNVILSLSDAR